MGKKSICPFCDGDPDGCCFCDHSGKVEVGENHKFKTEEDMKPFQKEFVKESDLRRFFDLGFFNDLKGLNKPNTNG